MSTRGILNLAIAAALLVGAAACGGDEDAAPVVTEFQGWSISAGTPVLGDDGSITGSVTFARQTGGDTRGGGVCLVADLYQAHPCSTEADCESLEVPEGGYHYCAGVNSAGVNGSATKTCWTRPSAAPCARSLANTPGTVRTPSVPALVRARATTWMSVACLAAEGLPLGCAGSEPDSHAYSTSPTLRVVP